MREPFETKFGALIAKLANISKFTSVGKFDSNTTGVSFIVGATEFFVPIAVDTQAEIAKITAEIERYNSFLASVRKKLSNEKFVSSAPKAVVDLERKKESDATEKLKTLNELLQRIK